MKAGEMLLKRPALSESAKHRAGRLLVKPTNYCWAYTLDLVTGVIFPALLGVGLAAISVVVVENVDGAADFIQQNIFAEQVLSSLGTMLVFLISMRLGANLSRNASTIGHFGNLCGVCVNLAIWCRSLVRKGVIKRNVYADSDGGTYKTTQIGLILASIPYVVKYTYRSEEVRVDMLPLAADNGLLAKVVALVAPANPDHAVAPFIAMIILLGAEFDKLERDGNIKPPELVLFYNQLNALTGEEGSIGGIDGYAPPGVLNFLMYLLFFIYFALLALGDLAVNNSWQSLWIIGVLVVGNLGLFQLSRRYANPFDVSPSRSTQKPIITDGARGTEIAIDAIFAKESGDNPDMPALQGVAAAQPTQFSIGLGLRR